MGKRLGKCKILQRAMPQIKAPMSMKRVIYWFRNDLRIEDNINLLKACEYADEIIPVYVIDKDLTSNSWLGIEKFGAYRKQFLLESLRDLHKALAAKHSGLLIYEGNLVEVFKSIELNYSSSHIFAQVGLGTEEQRQESLLTEAGFKLNLSDDHTLYLPNNLPFEISQTPETFTVFRKKIEKYATVPAKNHKVKIKSAVEPNHFIASQLPFFETTNKSTHPNSAFPFAGGRQSGLKRLADYLWQTDSITTYKETRNGLIGTNYSSKLSAWLALGCLSAREVYDEIVKYEKEKTKNESTYWLYFELLWRDFFSFMLMKHKDKIFKKSGIQGVNDNRPYRPKQLTMWIAGETNDAFVNANMKELAETGFMSNRGRQVVASYLVNDLNCDWRYGAAYFEKMLIDYDPGSNYGNWQYIAGVGNDPRPDRYFNPKTQAERYDPSGAFQKLWLTH